MDNSPRKALIVFTGSGRTGRTIQISRQLGISNEEND
jgi:hypothetical protein